MSGVDSPAPFRTAFDNARDPYTARNALGITSTAGGGGAPTNAEYITSTADPTLTAERVLTDTASITWDFSTPGQAKANAAAAGGNVSNSGTPTSGQYGKWVTATTIQGVSPATVLSDIGAQPAGSYLTTVAAAAAYQPLDADLTAIAALAGTNTIYYRSAASTWTAVTIGTNLTFSGGTLAAAGGGAAQPGNLALITAQTVGSAVATVDFTSGIGSTYDEYEIHIFNLRPATNAVGLQMRISQNSGSTWLSGAGSYFYSYGMGGTTPAGASGSDTAMWIENNDHANAAGSIGNFLIRFANPSSTTISKIFSFLGGYWISGAVKNLYGAGSYGSNTAAINGIRFLFNSGNIAQGTFILYGVIK